MAVTYNRVILAGNLTRDPEIRYLPSGLPVVNFSIAVNSRYRQNNELKEEVSFFDIVVFGKTGENCAEYLSKGRSVLVEGRLRQRRWESEGTRRSKIEVVAGIVQFLGGGGKGAPGSEEDVGGGAAGEQQDEDIPF